MKGWIPRIYVLGLQDLHIDIDDSASRSRFIALLEEYKQAVARLDKLDDRTLQFMGLSVTAIAALTGFLLNSQSRVPLIAFISPILYYVFFGVIVYQYYLAMSVYGACRILTIIVNYQIDRTYLQLHRRQFPTGEFFSGSKGNLKVKLIIPIVSICVFIAFSALLVSSFIIVRDNSYLAGTLFILLYGLMTAIMIYIVLGLFFDLPDLLRGLERDLTASLDKGFKSGSLLNDTFLSVVDPNNPIYMETQTSPEQSRIRVLFLLFPRPLDVVFKGIGFFYGVAIALAIAHMSIGQVIKANLLFCPGSGTCSQTGSTYLTAILLMLIYFVVQEMILQQGKLLWNDIRDIKDDANTSLYSRIRALPRGILTTKSAKWHALSRILFALAVAFPLGGINLLVLFLAVLALQATYEYVIEPGGKRYPKVPLHLLYQSMNYSVRALGGIVFVLRSIRIDAVVLLSLLILYFLSMASIVADWRTRDAPVKPYMEVFRYRLGKYIQSSALLSSFVTSIYLLLLIVMNESKRDLPLQFRDFSVVVAHNLGISWGKQLASDVFSLLLITFGVAAVIFLISAFIVIAIRCTISVVVSIARATARRSMASGKTTTVPPGHNQGGITIGGIVGTVMSIFGLASYLLSWSFMAVAAYMHSLPYLCAGMATLSASYTLQYSDRIFHGNEEMMRQQQAWISGLPGKLDEVIFNSRN